MGETAESVLALNAAGVVTFPVVERDKRPVGREWQKRKLKPPEEAAGEFDRRPGSNVGALCGEASGWLVVIDVDSPEHGGADGMETVREWERAHGELPETVRALTPTGGCHIYYRAPGAGIRNSTGKGTGVDVRGEGGFVVAPPSIHPNGGRYEWEFPPDEYAIAEADENVLAFIRHVQGGESERGGDGGGWTPFELPDEAPKGKRNDILCSYAGYMQTKGYADNDMLKLARDYNRDACKPPLPDEEVVAIVKSVQRYEKGKKSGKGKRKKDAGDGGRFSDRETMHCEIADALKDEYHFRFIGGSPSVWYGGAWHVGWREADRCARDLKAGLKKSMYQEIRNELDLTALRVEPGRPTLIAFSNGVLDAATLEFGENEPGMHIPVTIPHEWRGMDAACEDARKFLADVACGDTDVLKQLEETVGLCMFRSAEFAQCAVLTGEGSNGKSTFIKALRAVLGDDHVSSLDISELGERFVLGNLDGKLANLADDISSDYLRGATLANFRKVVSGEYVWTDVKNQEGYQFRPMAMFVISCNKFPQMRDTSAGMMRRLVAVPFCATFRPDDGSAVVDMAARLSTEDAAAYFIAAGVRGLHRLLTQGGMTKSAKGLAAVEDIEADSDSVTAWLTDCGINAEHLIDETPAKAYGLYAEWCESDGVAKPMTRRQMTSKIKAKFGLDTKAKRFSNGDVGRVFCVT